MSRVRPFALSFVTAVVFFVVAGAVSLGVSSCTPCGGGGGGGGEGGEGDGAAPSGGGYGCFGGAGDFSSTPPAGTPANAKCTTGAFWNGGNHGTELMHPGVDCIACHASGEGPNYTVAGTVMAGANDVDDCQGVSGAVVEITDKNGQVLSLTTDSAGNFFLRGALAMPYTAKVTQNGKTRQMLTPQSTGSCLSCHTATGANAAPGRILAP